LILVDDSIFRLKDVEQIYNIDLFLKRKLYSYSKSLLFKSKFLSIVNLSGGQKQQLALA